MPDKSLVYYLLGPMTGHPDDNFPAFAEAHMALTAAGYKVISPHQLGHARPGESYESVLRRAMQFMLSFAQGGIAMPNWEKSNGAQAEAFTLSCLGLPVHELHECLGGSVDHV